MLIKCSFNANLMFILFYGSAKMYLVLNRESTQNVYIGKFLNVNNEFHVTNVRN